MKAKMVVAAVVAVCLTGCADANAHVTDKDTVVFKIGDNMVTKDDVYRALVSDASDTIINETVNGIVREEVEVTDEIRAKAEETMQGYKEYSEEQLASFLDSMGLTEDEYMEEYLISNELAEVLERKYVTEHIDELTADKDPKLVTVFSYSSSETADENLKTMSETTESDENIMVITSDSDLYDEEAVKQIRETPAGEWSHYYNDDSSTYIVYRVEDKEMPDKVIDYVVEKGGYDQEMIKFYLKKHHLKVYDKTVHDLLDTSLPGLFD